MDRFYVVLQLNIITVCHAQMGDLFIMGGGLNPQKGKKQGCNFSCIQYITQIASIEGTLFWGSWLSF